MLFREMLGFYSHQTKAAELILQKVVHAVTVVCVHPVEATDPEARVRFPALPEKKNSSGSGTGSTLPRDYN
jgi:hypothetical protein